MTLEQAYLIGFEEGFQRGTQFVQDTLAARADLSTDAEMLEKLDAVVEFAKKFPEQLRRAAA